MKIFYAGADDGSWMTRALAGLALDRRDNMNLLTSFYKINSSKNKQFGPHYALSQTDNVNWIVDSGLFTMMFGAGKHKTYTEPDLTEYTKQYIGFMNNINYKHTLIELDVHKVLGLQSLAKFRAMFEKQWDTERTIFVWHIEEGIEGLIKLANTYPYIALSIPELRIIARQHKKKLKTMLYSLFNIIEKNTKEYPKIHLLGCTQQGLMKNNNHFSADSTSWLSPARFPHASVWANNTLIPCSQHNEQYKAFLNENAVAINNNLRFYAAKYHPKLKINEYSQKCAFGAYTLRQMENYTNHRYKEGKHE